MDPATVAQILQQQSQQQNPYNNPAMQPYNQMAMQANPYLQQGVEGQGIGAMSSGLQGQMPANTIQGLMGGPVVPGM